MRKITDIETQISEFQSQINGLEKRRNKAEIELEAAHRRYAKSIVDAESDEQTIENREAVTRLSIEFDAMSAAVDLVKEDLKKAEHEREIVLLYQTEGTRHNNQMAQVDTSIQKINSGLPELVSLVSELTSAIKGAFAGVASAASSLNGLATDLDALFSLEAFLNGHLSAVGDENRESLVNDIGDDLRNSVAGLDVPESISLSELEDLLETLHKWQAVVQTFDGIGLIKNPKQLAKPISRLPKTQHVVIPANPHSNLKTERPHVPIPKFDKNRPRGKQRVRDLRQNGGL